MPHTGRSARRRTERRRESSLSTGGPGSHGMGGFGKPWRGVAKRGDTASMGDPFLLRKAAYGARHDGTWEGGNRPREGVGGAGHLARRNDRHHPAGGADGADAAWPDQHDDHRSHAARPPGRQG